MANPSTTTEPSVVATARILVVDDSEDNRTLTATFLRWKGFNIEEAATGRQALQLATRLPDLIVLDVKLPDIDGFEVCRRLKTDPLTSMIPVLHLSGYRRTTDDRIRGMEEGADAYLVQPVDPDELLVTVKTLLRRRGSQPAPDSRPRARAEEAARALGDIGRELTAAADVRQATQRFVETVGRLFRVRGSAFYELDRVSSSLVCVASTDEGGVGAWLARTIAFGEGAGGLAVAEGRPVACADVLGDPRITLPAELQERMRDEPCRAVASVPLVAPGEILGAWSLVDLTGRVFTDEELRLLSAFADQVALALQNARLSEALERRLQESHGLLKVAELLNSSLESSEIARRAAREVTRLLGADTSIFFAVDEARGEAMAIAGYHIPPALWKGDYRLGLANVPAFFREAAATGRPIASDDVRNDPRLNHPIIRSMPITPRSMLCVPVLRDGHVSGALLTYWWSRACRVTDDGIRLAAGVTNQLVVALANAHLHAAEERRRREAEAATAQAEARLDRMRSLAELSHLVGSSLDVQRVLDFVTHAVLDLLNADVARLWIVDDAEHELRLMAETPRPQDDQDAQDRLALGTGVARWVIEQNETFYSGDTLQESRLIAKGWFKGHAYRSVIAVPLLAGDRVAGALMVATKLPRGFSDEDASLLEIFGAKAATALGNARLYQQAQRAYEELRQAQGQLVQSQKMEALGQLAGGIAHDFNNLLTVIEGRTQLVLKRLSADDRAHQDMAVVQQTASRAGRLTQQLLAFSRRQILQPRILDLNRVVTDFAAILERLIGEHIVLAVNLAPGLGAVRADRGHLEQVITNLCVNARDAQPSGGTVIITTRNVERDDHQPGEAPPGSYVMLSVSDTGCGMDADTLAHVFEPFFTTKDRSRGTGLGLSTVYGIVTQSGGYIRATSRPGEGATFEILLPRVEAVVDGEASSMVIEPAGGSETILLVEDNDEVRQLARDILELYGYRVLDAPNGERGLQTLKGHEGAVHLIVTDVVMPEMGGREFGERVAQTGHGTRILFMSGYPGEMSVPSDAPDTGRFFLAKPFSPRALAEKVRKALDTR